MGSLTTGGGSSAVAASAHAGSERYRHTDPLVTGRHRRELARALGHPDTTAGIPEARWVRAMTFERLVRHERFVSRLLTTAVGQLGLERPVAVLRADGGASPDTTAEKLAVAHERAVADGAATMVTGLAVPFVGLEHHPDATPVKPDFAIVARRRARTGGGPQAGDPGPVVGSWLIVGDAKDYERVRSRIDDQRMLKGFLQVALGAESAEAWSRRPEGMEVHRWGVLAVPRNAFLQPEAVVELLDDHRQEVRARAEERRQLLERGGGIGGDLDDFVRCLRPAYDPGRCVTCALHHFCREELRCSSDPAALLTEVGIAPELRRPAQRLLEGHDVGTLPASVVANLRATTTGRPVWTGRRRVDPVGLPGSINVVLAKSDAAALGVLGIGFQRVLPTGEAGRWSFTVFDEPQAPVTRTRIMDLLGAEIEAVRRAGPEASICIVTPDGPTGDVLVSIADSLAGLETSRLRWQRDLDQGRPALTFDGEPAVVPDPLTERQRLAVSFLLEEDRARAMTLRHPVVDVRHVLGAHLVAGGPPSESARLDYLVAWAEATEPLDHRAVSDDVASRPHTPGARLTNAWSDAVHAALQGRERRGRRGRPDPARYRRLVEEELAYKAQVVDRACAVLASRPVSRLRRAYLEIEAAAQAVWRRRVALHASDLVRFGRTSRAWRDRQVEIREKDLRCAAQLDALVDPLVARDMAVAAGTREVALATVVAVDPIRLRVRSRSLRDGVTVVALHQNGAPLVERPSVGLTVQRGSFKLSRMHLGELVADDDPDGLRWDVGEPLDLAVGDELIVADRAWFDSLRSSHEIKVERPPVDTFGAPRPGCTPESYAEDPERHRWCCRPHEAAEAEWADELARRREDGELNPQVWSPVLDEDQFDTVAEGSPTSDTVAVVDASVPEELTIDDLD